MHALPLEVEDFATQLRHDIASNKVRLPTLPDVALRVKDAVEAEASAPQIAQLVAQDASLSGRLLQVANCPLYRGKVEVDSVHMAVTRLGTKLVRTLMLSLAMRQLFNTSSKVLSNAMRSIWEDSVEVAALSRILASNLEGIDAEQAMLGGLLFNIGALPILARLDERAPDKVDPVFVQTLIAGMSATLGSQIVRTWNLPDVLHGIPAGCLDMQRDPSPEPDYVDIVLAARLQYLIGCGRVQMQADWADLPAFRKLGIHVEVIVLEDEGAATWASEVRSMLNS